MASLSRSKFPGSSQRVSDGVKGVMASFKSTDKDSSYLEEVIKKVRDHPDFKNLSSAEVKRQAKKLSSTELMKEYFSEYFTQVQDSVLQVAKVPETGDLEVPTPDGVLGVNTAAADLQHITTQEITTEQTTAVEQSGSGSNADQLAASGEATNASPFSHVQKVAAFPVKVYLTPLPPDANMTTENSHASTLETAYGPMQASLQIGSAMIEWTPHHLVVPHFNIPSEAVIKTDITRSLKIASELREKAREYRKSHRGTVTGEIDLMFEISKSISSVIETVIQVIASWNRYKYFHAYGSNSQHFVQNVIAVLGIEELPISNRNLSDYIGKLKGEFQGDTHKSFSSHAKLDTYVKQMIGKLRTSEMEYLLTEYYQFHVASRVGAMRTEGEWRCMEEDCQAQRLEREIDGKELLITSLWLT